MFFWAPEALGPFPACRSRRELSSGTIKSSINLQHFKMETKQYPKSTNRHAPISIPYFFIIFWTREALGPVSDCRSRREDSDGVVKSSGNLQNSEMVPNNVQRRSKKHRKSNQKAGIKNKWCLAFSEAPPEKRRCLNCHKVLYCCH